MNEFHLEEINMKGQATSWDNAKQLKKVPEQTERIGIKIIRDEASFYQLSNEWESLARMTDAPVFISFDWASSWWKYYGRHPRRRLFILVFYKEDKVIGILPLFEGRSAIGRLCLKRRLSLFCTGVSKNEFLGFGDDYGCSDFLDAIVHPDYRNEVAESLTGYISRIYRYIDTISFQHISDNSFLYTEVLPRLMQMNIPVQAKKSDICPFLPVPESLKKYVRTRRSSVRRRFRQTIRSIGPDEWYIIEDVSALKELKKGLSVLRKLHQDRWNSIGFPGLFFDRRFTRFIVEFSEKAARGGNLWFKLAKENGHYCAARFAIRYNGRYYDYLTGFDEESEASKRRPGIGLLIDLIEDSIAEQGRTIEFLRGTENYKKDFTGEHRVNWRLDINKGPGWIYPRRLTAQLVNMTARIYGFFMNELRLLRVHLYKSGPLKVLFAYGKFRWNSLKIKLRERNS